LDPKGTPPLVEKNREKVQICFLEQVEENDNLFSQMGSLDPVGIHPLMEKNLEKLQICFLEVVVEVKEALFS
jgi:hypothetical protein